MTEASIVFRTADIRSTSKIYVDKMSAALDFAARFRNACTFVDIITRQDEVAYRWKNGAVEWDQYGNAAKSSEQAPYDFVRKGDPFWVAENRMYFLKDVLEYSLQVVQGHENQDALDAFGLMDDDFGLEAWDLVHDAHAFAVEVSSDTRSVEQMLEEWKVNSDTKYLLCYVEFMALSINRDLWI